MLGAEVAGRCAITCVFSEREAPFYHNQWFFPSENAVTTWWLARSRHVYRNIPYFPYEKLALSEHAFFPQRERGGGSRLSAGSLGGGKKTTW